MATITPVASDPTSGNWILLGVFFLIALGVSFLCSLTEAVMLSLPRSHAVRLRKEGRTVGVMLEEMKGNIDRPLAAILTLNTISHTVGAAGVGAQAVAIAGPDQAGVASGIASAILTVAILIGSEIIPKSWGAKKCRSLAPFTAYTVRGMMMLTLPIVWALELINRMLFGASTGHHRLTREDVALVAELSTDEGALEGKESRIIRNLLRLRDVRIKSIATPRTVISMFQKDMKVDEAIKLCERNSFSRFPVFGENPDDIKGIVLRRDLSDAARTGKGNQPISNFERKIHHVPEAATVENVLWKFFSTGHHMFHVVDEYGGTAGVITLEDAIEAMFGHEIVDETDAVVDMRRLARSRGSVRKKSMPTPHSSDTSEDPQSDDQ